MRCKHIIACQIRDQQREKVRENVILSLSKLLLASTTMRTSEDSESDITNAEKSKDSYIPLPANLQRESRL